MNERQMRHPVSKQMQQEIGNFIVSYALMEFYMRQLAFSLTQKNTRMGMLIIEALPTKDLKNIIATALDIELDSSINPELVTEVKTLFKQFQRFIDMRNLLLHCVWAVGRNGNEALVVKSKATESGYKRKNKLVTSSELSELSLEMARFAHKVLEKMLPQGFFEEK